MKLYYKPKKYVPAPEGLHHAVCIDWENLGMQTVSYEGNERNVEMVKLVFQLDKLMPTDPGSSEPPKNFSISKRYTQSLHEKASLRKDLESWRGRRFTEDELANQGFELEELVGKNCQLQIMHKEGTYNGNPATYANITSILPPAEGASTFLPDGSYTRVKEHTAKQEQALNSFAGGGASGDPAASDHSDIPF